MADAKQAVTSIIVCTSPWGRLKVGNRYVWVDFHEYCGPSFYTDAAMSKLYDPKDENDPVWEQFDNWLKKYRAGKEKQVRAAHFVGWMLWNLVLNEAKKSGADWPAGIFEDQPQRVQKAWDAAATELQRRAKALRRLA